MIDAGMTVFMAMRGILHTQERVVTGERPPRMRTHVTDGGSTRIQLALTRSRRICVISTLFQWGRGHLQHIMPSWRSMSTSHESFAGFAVKLDHKEVALFTMRVDNKLLIARDMNSLSVFFDWRCNALLSLFLFQISKRLHFARSPDSSSKKRFSVVAIRLVLYKPVRIHRFVRA